MSPPKSLLEIVGLSFDRLNAAGRRICVGLSGGLDSVVLLRLLVSLREHRVFELSAIHVHHGLSPNADRWQLFCGSLCASEKIPMSTVRVSVDRNSAGGIEALARARRYAAFSEIDADFVALAQHADDQAETVLHQILRGTGLKGTAGMGETRRLPDGPVLWRPVLAVTRSALEEYAKQNGLRWIEDESNADTAYTRNFLRHEIMPRLAGRFPHYRESLARIGRHAAESDEMLAALAAIDLQWDGKEARAELLDALPLARQVNALYHWLNWMRPAGSDRAIPSHAQLEEWAPQIFRPAHLAPPGRPHQAGGHDFVIRRRKNLLFLEWK